MWIWYCALERRNLSGSSPPRTGTDQHTDHQELPTAPPRGRSSTHWSARLHAAGLNVCAWQYVYGDHPVFEARSGPAVNDGADCLMIDAESRIRRQVRRCADLHNGAAQADRAELPVALAGFPYIDYHPGVSIFVVPRAGRRPVQHSADVLDGHRYERRRRVRPYLRVQPACTSAPIFPLGQVYNNPPPGQIIRFRQLSRDVRLRRRELVGLAGGQPAGWARRLGAPATSPG